MGIRKIRGAVSLSACVMAVAIFSTSPAQAETAERVLAKYPSGGHLMVETVGKTVAMQAGELEPICRSADEASPNVQAAVGAGFALAYQLFIEANRLDEADYLTGVVCSCERTDELILASYAAARGESVPELCSGAIEAGSGPPSSFFHIRAEGGGGGAVSPE